MAMGASKEVFTVGDCSFKNITTTKNGGVMYLENIGNMIVGNSSFQDNSAVDGAVFYYHEENSKNLCVFYNIFTFFSLIFLLAFTGFSLYLFIINRRL